MLEVFIFDLVYMSKEKIYRYGKAIMLSTTNVSLQVARLFAETIERADLFCNLKTLSISDKQPQEFIQMIKTVFSTMNGYYEFIRMPSG